MEEMNLRASRLLQIVLEETTLFGSLVKWTRLASSVGILVGFSTTLFLWVLGWATQWVGRLPGALWLLPPGFLLAHLLVQYLAPDAEGHGTEKVIEAVHQRSGRIAAKVAMSANRVLVWCP